MSIINDTCTGMTEKTEIVGDNLFEVRSCHLRDMLYIQLHSHDIIWNTTWQQRQQFDHNGKLHSMPSGDMTTIQRNGHHLFLRFSLFQWSEIELCYLYQTHIQITPTTILTLQQHIWHENCSSIIHTWYHFIFYFKFDTCVKMYGLIQYEHGYFKI